MAFYETQFPTNISGNSKGGPKWRTVVTISHSGKEVRNQKWQEVRNEYDVSYGLKQTADLVALVEFFNEMRGKAHGFRYKDWLDYSVTDEALVPTGANTVQLIKTYGNSFNDYAKNIKKPIAGITMEHNSSPFGTFVLDDETGIATLTALSSNGISNITQASPGVVTSTAHPFSDGDEIYLTGIGGMTELNGTVVTISGSTANTFSTGVDTTSYTAYTSSGTAEKHVQSTDTLTWSGQFDIPCRFDTDVLQIDLETVDYGGTSIPLVELKL